MNPLKLEELKREFKCLRCGKCCEGESTISLSKKEIEKISKFLKITEEEFSKLYTINKGPYRIEMKVVNGHCIFFEPETRSCKIHPVKPEKCKEWPFIPALLKDSVNFLIIQDFCKGFKNLLNLKVE